LESNGVFSNATLSLIDLSYINELLVVNEKVDCELFSFVCQLQQTDYTSHNDCYSAPVLLNGDRHSLLVSYLHESGKY